MDNTKLMMLLPNLQPEELMYIKSITGTMSESQIEQFVLMYQGKRKDTQTLLLVCLLAFFGAAGIQRFMLGQTGMGVLYFITWGFCGIGQLIDIINIKGMTSKYNQAQAMETASMVKMMHK
jgi:TM2 domain-containing membrane protein YozV